MSETETTSARVAQAANLFDLRRIIGGVFAILGLLLTILGLTESQAEIDKAAGVNINLWAGLGMLAFALFLASAGWSNGPLTRAAARATRSRRRVTARP